MSLVAALGLAASACTPDSGAADPPPPTEATVAPTTVPPTTASPTTAPATTIPTTVPPTTIPTTSPLPGERPEFSTPEEEIRWVFGEFWTAFDAAILADPIDTAASDLDLYGTSQLADEVRADLRSFRDDEITMSLPEASQARREIMQVTAEESAEPVSEEDLTAALQFCEVDDVVVADNAGQVVDDEIVTRSFLMLFDRLDDGRWYAAGYRQLQSWEGVAGCALRSS